jgi:hypothetical protein
MTTVPRIVCLWFPKTEPSLGPTGRNIPLYTCTHLRWRSHSIHTCIPFPSTLPYKASTMEHSKRVAASSAWDCLPEEFVSMVVVKVVETSKAPLEDLRSLRLFNNAMKKASLSHAVTNRFNLMHHYQPMIWGDGDTCATYRQTVD